MTMVSYQERALLRIIRQFEGMSKIDAYDILQKIEILLDGFTSPIKFDTIKKSIHDPYTNNNVVAIGDQGFCYREDYCHFIHVYTFKSIMPSFLGGKSTYFTVGDSHKLLSFTAKNVKETFDNTHLEYAVYKFLKSNGVKKRNPKTKRLLLLELFDRIDPE